VHGLTNRDRPLSAANPGVDAIVTLHFDVDREAHRLHVLHAPRLQCRLGCSSCCVDGLTVFDAEADLIRRRHADLLDHGTPHAEGACAFLGEDDACRIYADRPYVCRTQGLPLRWIEQEDDRDATELRDICPLNEAGEPIENLPADDCWTIGPTEVRLGQLQLAGGGGARRTSLRDLFVVPRSAPR
jgi:Fe-S-cluster containining protein